MRQTSNSTFGKYWNRVSSGVLAIVSSSSLCLLLAGCAATNSSNSGAGAASNNNGTLTPSSSLVNFGNVPTGTTDSQIITITNLGIANTEITQLDTTGAGFSVNTTNMPIRLTSGESTSITVMFCAAGSGTVAGSLTVQSDAENVPVTIALNANSTASSVPPAAVAVSQDGNNQLNFQWTNIAGVSSYQLLVDDSPYFRTPILSQTVSDVALGVDAFQSGFAPGVTYYVQVMPGGMQTTFRLKVPTWSDSSLTYSYARASWETSGHLWMTEYSGIEWNTTSNGWVVDPEWPDVNTLVAQDAYSIEYAARGALNIAAVKSDLTLLDELAAFYVAYENRFTTLGAMRALTQYDSTLLTNGPDSTKTLLWVYSSGSSTYVSECDLCNSQFYNSAARLLRIISTLPVANRTQSMQAFADWYAPVITEDHLLRLSWRAVGSEMQRIQASPGSVSDEDLWLAAEAAEMLGAHANDPNLVPLTSSEISQLQQVVETTVQALQNNNRNYYPNTQNFQKQTVGSVSYFQGQFTAPGNVDPDYLYSGYTGQKFPTSQDAAVNTNASWDISHFHRVPIFLRALYDNKKATGLDFPSSQEIQWVTNQLMYQNFQGNFAAPLFNNYFDGSNGWYRVGYHGQNFGYPPAQYCDDSANASAGADSLPCLISGAVQGWGSVAFLNPDLTQLEHSLSSLALSTDPAQIAFRDRYYYYAAQNYAVADASANPQYPILLFFVLSGAAENLQ
jgi:hypothetical protein